MTLEASLDFNTISPVEEISAYETLWTKYPTLKKIRDIFSQYGHNYPTEIAKELNIHIEELEKTRNCLEDLFSFKKYTALFRNDIDYPLGLKDLNGGPEVIYFQGSLELLANRCVSVVGARKASEEGIKRTRKLVKLLSDNKFTIMSGLAAGIDTSAHLAAIEAGGITVGVIGTPLSEAYPRINRSLQEEISNQHLLISQVPFYQTTLQDYRLNRFFFPERNRTMASLSIATIIVEASDTSGSLTQAKEAIKLKRKLFILNSCFEQGLTWPQEFLAKGAVRVVDGSEILEHLNDSVSPNVQ